MRRGTARAVPSDDASLLAALLGAASLLGVLVVLWQAGPLPALGAAALAVAGLLLLNDARAALLAALGTVALAESTPDWGIPFVALAYEVVFGIFAPVDLLLMLATASVGLHVLRSGGGLRLPTGFVAPLAVLALAYVAGGLNGVLGGEADRSSVVSQAQNALPLFVVPLLIVNVLRTREDLRAAVGWVGAIAVVKAVLGLVVVFGGLASVETGIGRLTYYEVPGNLIALLALLTLLAAGLARVPMPVWLRWSVPLLALSLLLSYRRTFWLATIVSTFVVYLVASGRTGRRLFVPGAGALVVAGVIVVATGIAGRLEGPLVERARSLDPARVETTAADRYRIGERRNVLAEIGERPLTGIGIGVRWQARYALPRTAAAVQQYVHLSALWHWLRNGILGLVGYLWLIAATFTSGLWLWRHCPDRVLAAAGLAAGVAALGLAVVELASSVVGVEYRGTVVFATLVGLLSAGRSMTLELKDRPVPPTTMGNP